MALLLGTRDGCYRAGTVPFESDPRRMLDGPVSDLARTGDAVLVVADGDLHRSTDGESFDPLPVPADRVTAVTAGPDGTLYAGTDPSRLFRSTDGEDWTELDALQSVPSRDRWPKRGGQDAVSAVALPAPDRIAVGVEPAGVHVSDDGGESFGERRYGLHDDLHDLLVEGPGTWLAATGSGLYRTGDAGRTWARIDTNHDHLEYTYFRAVARHGGRRVAAAATGAPGSWGESVEAALFESTEGENFERVPLPDDAGFPVAFAVWEGSLLAGTTTHDPARPGTDPGHLLVRRDDGWALAGETPAGVVELVGI